MSQTPQESAKQFRQEYSNYHHRGEIYTDDGAIAVSLPTADTGVVSTGWTDGENTGAGFVVVDGANGTITIGEKGAGVYLVTCGASFGSSKANVTIHGYLTVNGVKAKNTAWRRDIATANDVGNANKTGHLILRFGDVVRFVLESDTNTTTVTIDHGGFSVTWISGVAPPIAENPGTDNLILWYELDTVNDSHGSNNLTNNGASLSAAGADFELSESDFMELADNPDVSTGDIDYIWYGVIKLETKAVSSLVLSKADDGTNREFAIFYFSVTDRFVFAIYNSAGAAVGTVTANNLGSPSVATDYFFACWHDPVANTVNIQINNGTLDSAATSGVPADKTANLRLGAQFTTEQDFLDGLLKKFAFFKELHTEEKRTWMYNEGNFRAYSELG